MNMREDLLLPEWQVRPVGDVTLSIQSGFASGKHNADGDGVIHVRPMNVSRDGRLAFTETKFVADSSDRRLARGDVVFNNTNSPALVGKTAYVDTDLELAFSNHMTRLRPVTETVTARFLAAQLHAMQLNGVFEEICSNHVNQASVSAKRLAAVDITVPPLPEQERIVDVLEEQLSRLDATLASIKTVRAKAGQIRRSLLNAAFNGALTGHSENEWQITTLNDLVAVKSDIVDGPFGSNLKSAHYVDDGARVVRLQNIGFGEFVPGDAHITLAHFETLAKHNVKEGDLLFASLGENLPRACLAPRFEEPAIVKADCIRVRLRPEVNPRFVLHATQRPEAKHWASEALHGMGRPRLGLGTIRMFPVPLPPRSVQDQIVAAVEAELSRLDAALAGADRAEFACAALRRSVLHAAFTGKLTEEWRKTHV